MEKLKLYYPVKPYVLNQGFGLCLATVCDFYKSLGLKGHNGEDMYAPDGTIVRASHDGVVTFAGEDGAGGLGVVIRTHNKFAYGQTEAYYKTIYWHLKKDSIVVKVGQSVVVGDVVGLADNTGVSSGSHLHFGLKPVYQGEAEWQWWNAEQENGYKGSIDPSPFWTGEHAEGKYGYAFNKDLQYGDEGADVRALQTILQKLGMFPATQNVTGFFGRITQDSVKRYQVMRKIAYWYTPGWGRCGPRTRAVLNVE